MIQIKRILCPIDFSDHSRHALDHAVVVARWYGSAITVLHVQHLFTPALTIGQAVVPDGSLAMTLTDQDRANILGAMSEFVTDDRASGMHVDVHLAEDLSVADAIVAEARAVEADLIVIGTHGRTGFDRWALGSVAEKVLRTASPPVLTVPPRAPGALPLAAEGLGRVLCPVDFSACSRNALDLAASLAQEGEARLTVAHVVELLPDLPEMPVAQVDAYRTARFDAARRAMSQLLSAGVRDACAIDELLLAGKPYREILRLASEQQAGLIVMGVHGRGAVHRLFFGSTTNHVVRQAPCPVLTRRGD